MKVLNIALPLAAGRRAMVFGLFFMFATISASAQSLRPDAFPPVEDTLSPKALTMATTLEEMDRWNRYPTYDVYTAMMQRFVERYPDLCRVDTIGVSIQGRLILCLAITGSSDNDLYRPEFFYSSTMHGDELTGFYLMLRLCDTLLGSYGTSRQITSLLDRTRIYINPLSNPDGTYYGGDSTVALARRYNADSVDLNRNYPDPFGTPPLDSLQPDNQAMIAELPLGQFHLVRAAERAQRMVAGGEQTLCRHLPAGGQPPFPRCQTSRLRQRWRLVCYQQRPAGLLQLLSQYAGNNYGVVHRQETCHQPA